jgi:hypothetical protein
MLKLQFPFTNLFGANQWYFTPHPGPPNQESLAYGQVMSVSVHPIEDVDVPT